MDGELLDVRESSRRLGIRPTTLYEWLGLSRRGMFAIRGQRFEIEYLQGGPRGQGRIRIEAQEVERIKHAMRVKTRAVRVRALPVPRTYPGITVKPGRPSA